MSELRLNVVTKEWVIIAPERATRPHEHSTPPKIDLPSFVPTCPFCPGNESMTTAEVFRIDGADGSWRTRTVLNKFPVLNDAGPSPTHRHTGLQHMVDGFGVHEVIVETPRHDLPMALMTLEEVRGILLAYRERYNAARSDPRVAHVIVFKNHGAGAGTSLIHPHSQLIATPVISYQVRDRIRTLEEHFGLYGECILCRMIREEIEQETRLLVLNESFVALIPYAALSRYHIWIFPRRHIVRYGDVTDDELSDLADALRTVLRQLYFGLGNPDFNFLIRSAPRTCSNEEFHWYLSVVPRIGQAAGFELGSGIYVNTSFPEDSARFLRSVRFPP